MRKVKPAWIKRLLAPQRRPAWRVLLLALLIVVSWLAFKPVTGPAAFEHLDKVEHVLAFGTLAVVASLCGAPGPGLAWRVALALLAYGGFIELVQTQLPTRTGSLDDLVADAAGIALGLWLARRMPRGL